MLRTLLVHFQIMLQPILFRMKSGVNAPSPTHKWQKIPLHIIFDQKCLVNKNVGTI